MHKFLIFIQKINLTMPQLTYKFYLPKLFSDNWHLNLFWIENDPYSVLL